MTFSRNCDKRCDERYEDIILQVLPAEKERVRSASYEKMDFGLVEIRHMVHTMFVEILSRSFHSKPVAGHGIAMQAAGHTNSDVRCNYRRGVGYFRSDCTILKAKEQRHGPIRCGQRTQLQHNQEAPRRAKTNGEQARKGRDDKHQWCSFRKLTTHSDADCRTQHHNKIDGGSVHCATHLYYPAVLSARDHPPDCNSEDPLFHSRRRKHRRRRRSTGRSPPRMNQ